MALVKRLLHYLRPGEKVRPACYSEEVLYAEWVQLPVQPPTPRDNR